MIQFYYHPSPSPLKVALLLEECGLPYEVVPHVKRLLDEVNARPAAQRAEALKTRYTFKAEMDDDARKAMFPQNARLTDETSRGTS